MLWTASSLQRVSHCGRVPVSNAGHVSLRLRDSMAGYSGLQHCGSVWACPVCASRILVHRALEIGTVLGEAIRAGHALGFVTLTMRHHRGQNLADLWDAAGRGWRRAITGRGWVSASEMVDGWVRVWEVTEGRNGWHVHVHLVLVLAEGTDAGALDAVASGMYERWGRGLVAAGLDAPKRVGQDWHLATGDRAASDLADYLAKSVSVVDSEDLAAGLGLELTHGMAGRAREGLATRPVWSMLDEMAETGDLTGWREWEKASKGKRQVGWSVGLRERFAPSLDEQTDDQIVAQEVGDETDDIAFWTAEEWAEFVAHPTHPTTLLNTAEVYGREQAQLALLSWGVRCSIIDRLPSSTPDRLSPGAALTRAPSPP